MITYASLPRFRERLGLAEEADARLLLALRHATAQIDRYTARRFAPVQQTRHYRPREPYTLRLEIDLLALHSLTLHGLPADLDLVRLLPEGDGSKVALVLPAGGDLRFDVSVFPEAGVTVTGLWGTHNAWSEAWLDSGDTVQDSPLAANAATITVTDVAGADGLGLAPRFSAGQLLRLEDEFLHVIGADAAACTLSVIRGVRGTEAVTHPAGAPLAIYAPPLDVQALCLRWAAWLYQQVDASIGAGADWLYPPDLPEDLYRLAAPLRYLRVA